MVGSENSLESDIGDVNDNYDAQNDDEVEETKEEKR